MAIPTLLAYAQNVTILDMKKFAHRPPILYIIKPHFSLISILLLSLLVVFKTSNFALN